MLLFFKKIVRQNIFSKKEDKSSYGKRYIGYSQLNVNSLFISCL